MSTRGSVLRVSSRALLDACARLGFDTGQILAAANLDPVTLQDPNARIPVEQVDALWRKAYERSNDPTLFSILDTHARMLLDQVPSASDLVGRVREAIQAELRGGSPQLESIAKRLAMSPRTLQRRLKDEGVLFNDLLDAMRFRAAVLPVPGRHRRLGGRVPAGIRRTELLQPRLQALGRPDTHGISPPDGRPVTRALRFVADCRGPVARSPVPERGCLVMHP
jgi:hypothetical protein